MGARIGKVYLVGAGPGDPKLITVRGLEALRKADAVVYDRLAGPRLLKEIKPGADVIYVGKRSERHTMKQEDINRLLVELALQGKTVVRLKGGDPCVFGRVGEEAEALAAHGISFDIIPGVTSATGVPAYAGIPLTHRDLASSFAVVTGYENPEKAEMNVDWARLATAVDTLVFLMGVSKNRPDLPRADRPRPAGVHAGGDHPLGNAGRAADARRHPRRHAGPGAADRLQAPRGHRRRGRGAPARHDELA